MRRSNFDLETLIERMMGEVVENTDEPSFGEGQAPPSGLACVICLIMALIWELVDGRPPIFRRDRMVQKSRKTLRCQPMTVSGLTMSKGARHSDQIRDNQTQNRRSFVLIAGRFWVRFRMASCCRKARFSRAKLH